MDLYNCSMPAIQDEPDAITLREDATIQPKYSSDEIPNAETLKSINELEDSNGELFTGSTKELFKLLTESDDQPKNKGMCFPTCAFHSAYVIICLLPLLFFQLFF